ncbi:hypothetical protein SEA_RIOVINA_58 [Arthrobacter phage Riovina]|uniref:Uncharacterized protein n=4 Tax=Korravirus hunterdalle TaxID=1982080 RepID=A0A3G8FWA8_9CAUD|nr:hypothetical protein SEA_ALEDEL_58 [Arthrobacter phage Aledel]AZS07744.1 hypothetical protein SEA_EUNOIA_60 [Arthrobacter phage Eunoia]AZS09205.1 hypothetical protein SEA_OMALLEY_58 [Arthrobacter phage OMalley]AZS09688.1 hypothetical protein SEA_RIOVINA_58 [Arthrobacter phage Riovina]AZS10435.1 hypothetical protein SEA_SUPAKEV_58 [Arthrobacter phage Supakev]
MEEPKTRPVLPHTFGRWWEADMTRAQRREFARAGRQKGQGSKVERTRAKKRKGK